MTQPTGIEAREQWLLNAFDALIAGPATDDPRTTDRVLSLPTGIRITCGFPPRTRDPSIPFRVLSPDRSADGSTEIFISPTLSEPLAVVLALSGALVSLLPPVRGEDRAQLAAELAACLPLYTLPAYPHAEIFVPKAQSTRMVKVQCSETDCAFLFRASRAQLHKLPDAPVCPACEVGTLVHDGDCTD